jgi:hypothetical protein
VEDQDAAVSGSLRDRLAELNAQAAAELRELDGRLAAALGAAVSVLRDRELPNATADFNARLGDVRQRLQATEDEQERSAAALGGAVAGIEANRTKLSALEDDDVQGLERALADGLREALAEAADTAAAVRVSNAGVAKNLSEARAAVVEDQVSEPSSDRARGSYMTRLDCAGSTCRLSPALALLGAPVTRVARCRVHSAQQWRRIPPPRPAILPDPHPHPPPPAPSLRRTGSSRRSGPASRAPSRRARATARRCWRRWSRG